MDRARTSIRGLGQCPTFSPRGRCRSHRTQLYARRLPMGRRCNPFVEGHLPELPRQLSRSAKRNTLNSGSSRRCRLTDCFILVPSTRPAEGAVRTFSIPRACGLFQRGCWRICAGQRSPRWNRGRSPSRRSGRGSGGGAVECILAGGGWELSEKGPAKEQALPVLNRERPARFLTSDRAPRDTHAPAAQPPRDRP